MATFPPQLNSSSDDAPNKTQRMVHITDKPFYRYSYHPALSSSITDSFCHHVSGKYLRGERLWEQSPTLTNTLRIGQLLGKGGYGEVYEIWKVSDPQHRFALKIPGPPLNITRNYILNEIQKLKLLSKPGNPHIPKIKDGFFYIRNEKIPYYITHILKAVERKYPTFAQNQPMDPLETLIQFYFIASGLKYITSHHIVHNDIKPENIMFYHNLPIITDYGTARSYSEINEIEFEKLQGRLHGTPTWLPPELISISPSEENSDNYLVYYNLSNVGQKTDVWGLVLVLMRYLLGESLFHDVPIKNYQVPDIFFTTYQQFYEAKIVARYRQHAYRRLSRFYEIRNSLDMNSNFLNIDILKSFLFHDTKSETEKLNEQYMLLQCGKEISSNGKENSAIRNATTGRILTAKVCLKKLQFISRSRSNYETAEFFLSSIFDIFDLCVAPVESRIKSYQLVDILEILFPGMLPFCQKQLDKTIFPELIFSEMVS